MTPLISWADVWSYRHTFCAAHEVVEVDGFVFKRKRSILEPTADTTEQNQPADKKPKLLSTPDTQNLPLTVSKTPVPLAATGVEGGVAANIAAVKTPDAQAVSAATTALLEQLPPDVSEPDRLASLCELLCAAELDELSTSSAQEQQLDATVADAVRQVLGTFVRSVQSSVAAGRFQVCASGHGQSVLEPTCVQQRRADVLSTVSSCTPSLHDYLTDNVVFPDDCARDHHSIYSCISGSTISKGAGRPATSCSGGRRCAVLC